MFRDQHLVDKGPVLFAVEDTLVLEPAPVVLHARNLLSIVVRNGVLRAA